MSSEPMFSDEFEDPFSVTEAVRFPARGTHAPSWYQKHTKPRTTLVVKDGIPVGCGFMVSEVAPERRWAIQENGEVLDELEFQEKHLKWWSEFFTIRGGAIPSDPAARAIPRVERFVSMRVSLIDPTNTESIVRTYEEAKRFQPLVQYDQDGNNPQAPVAEVKDADGNVTGFEAVGDRDEVVAAVARARELLVSEDEDEPPMSADAVEYVTARCGAKVEKRKHGPHVRFQCVECKRLRALEIAEKALNGKK